MPSDFFCPGFVLKIWYYTVSLNILNNNMSFHAPMVTPVSENQIRDRKGFEDACSHRDFSQESCFMRKSYIYDVFLGLLLFRMRG